MKLIKFFLGLILLVIILIIGVLGYLGLVPGLSSLFGSDKPRNLGIVYSEADKTSARGKSQIEYGELPSNVSPELSLVRTGSRTVKTEFTSQEITALMNNRPWKYWPYSNVQVKFNGDGSAEISGVFLKDKLEGYGAYIGAPKEAIAFAAKYLPANPVFYVKMKAALADNKVSVFEPTAFELGRMPMPVGAFLAFVPRGLFKKAYAVSPADMISELSKVKNKRELIIGYINGRLSTVTGFYAKSASFGDNTLLFDGTLSEKESTAR
jgi:hypothetical protein